MRVRLSTGAVALVAALVFVPALVFVGAQPSSTDSLQAADEAWQRGDYLAALNGFIQVLNESGGDAHLEDIALVTGELFPTSELTDDGRAGRFSPDGRYIAYETGLEVSRRTRIVRNDDSRALVAELPGVSATFARDGARVAFFRIEDTEDIRRAGDAIAAASLTAQNRSALVQNLTWLVTRDSTIVIRDLATARDTELRTPSLLKSNLVYAADGQTLYFLGARESDLTRTDIYRISPAAPVPEIAVQAEGLKSAPIVDSSGAVLVYTIPTASSLRRPAGVAATEAPAPAAEPPAPTAAGLGRGAAGAGPGGPARPSFAIASVPSGSVKVVTGTLPVLSADGRSLAYVTREGAENAVMVGPTTGAQSAVLKTTARIDAPALSPDGRRLAWQQMLRDDWEVFVADIGDGPSLKDTRRVTREIQHDVVPRFLNANRLLAVIGEPRHRRSHLYDLTPDAARVRTRLFHNNTVRTIAPEYQWAASPDGTQLVVGAERDGDTVSPKRGVYLVDTRRTVSKVDLLARLRRNLAAESALRTAGTTAFRPIAAEVRDVVSRASVDRVFAYEKALFDFDSKNIARPGNRLASEYLFNTYTSFGYTPEYQWFEQRNALGGRTANVVATLRGTVNPELVYVISSHYDSVEAGPGADDDSSGTAALLEAARVLANHPLPATVMFASMTGEESGLLGSREFVRRSVGDKVSVVGVLNNDMIGWANDQRLDNTIRYSNPGIRDIQHAAAMLFTSLITYDALYWKGTDAMSFYDVYGDVVGGIGSYPVLGSPYYHQANDVLANMDHRLITETSKTTVATIMLLASSPSRLTGLKIDGETASGTSLSWTPGLEQGIAAYLVAYGPPDAPLQRRVTVNQPRATLPRVAPGTIVSVKAINARGLEGWDWARVVVQ